MDLLAKGLKDLRSVLQPDGDAGGASGVRRGRGTGPRGGRASRRDSQEAAPALQFPEAWKVYCAANPRLRDPRTLPGLVRRGVPEHLRLEVWSHCLGIESSSSAPAEEAEPASVASRVACGNLPATCSTTPGSTTPGSTTPVLSQEAPLPEAPADEASEQIGAAALQPEVKVQAVEQIDAPERKEPREEPQEEAEPAQAQAAEQEQPAETPQATAADPGLPHGIADLIEADVLRTFPTNVEFQSCGGPDMLRHVLRDLALNDTEIGYCQSLNFIAAVFIMVLRSERAAFHATRQLLVKLGSRSWYTDSMKQLRADTMVLEGLVSERLPAVHKAFQIHRFDLLFVSSKWFLCLFAASLEGEALRRVWDVMLCDGIEAVFRIAFAILAQHAEEIVRAKSTDDLIYMFQELQPDPSPEALIQVAYNPAFIGPISRSDLAQRRRQAAAKVSTDDTRAEMRNRHFWRGGVRPASVLAR